MPERLLAGSGRLARSVIFTSAALLLGVPAALLFSVLLAETGVLSVALEWAGAVLMILSGLLAGRLRNPDRLKHSLTWSLPGAAVLFTGIVVILNLPRCGEWIAGGWDPGIYINQGVAVARFGTFHPPAEPHHAALTGDELALFTSGSKGHAPQLFPAVPVDPQNRNVLHYFFRLTPACVSTLALHGGLNAATRMPAIAGLLVLLVFPGFLTGLGCRPACAWIASLLLASHPVWLYHLHFPASEMPELFFFLGLATLLPFQHTGWYSRLLFLLLLFAAILNRLSFFPIALMLTMAAAWADMERPDRRQVLTGRMLQLLVILLAVAYDYTFARVTVDGLQYALTDVFGAALVFMAGTALLDWASVFKRSASRLTPAIVFGLAAAALALTAIGSVFLWRHAPVLAGIRRNTLHLSPFLGAPWLIPAVPGMLLLWLLHARRLRHLSSVTLVCTVITLLLLVKTFTFPFYPWTTRRFLPFTVPLLATGAAFLLAELWHWGKLPRPARRLCVVLLLGAILAFTARSSWHALSGSEYDGLSARLAHVAKQIGPRDIVIVDHFKWGTPLMFIHGAHVLDGSTFHDTRGAASMPEALKTLSRLKAAGWRILWLSSTPAGLEIYPQPVPGAVLLADVPPLTFREIIHGPRVRDFVRRERTVVFQLYQWP